MTIFCRVHQRRNMVKLLPTLYLFYAQGSSAKVNIILRHFLPLIMVHHQAIK